MSDSEKDHVRVLLNFRDVALRNCKHLGMTSDEMGAYLLLCKAVGKVPVIGGRERPDLIPKGD